MLIHEEPWENFRLALDFKLSKGCNSGIFVRTFPLTPRPGKDVGFNGLEIALDDTTTAGYTDTGAIYDLAKPSRNAMRPIGQWNHIEITCDKSVISVVLNGEPVTRMDMDQFTARIVGPTAARTSSISPTRITRAAAISACKTTVRPAGSEYQAKTLD